MIREIDPCSRQEIELVASRMRLTLIDVLGEQVGGNMYSMDWLIQRAEFHLDPSQCVGQIFLALSDAEEVIGHTIVRVQDDENAGKVIGLFSTIYVQPEYRNQSVATRLLRRGEEWMVAQGMDAALTYTAENNERLRRLLTRLGYKVIVAKHEMVGLLRELDV